MAGLIPRPSESTDSLPALPNDLPAALAPGGPEEEPGLDLSRIFAAIRRFKWLIAACVVAGLGGGWVATRYIAPLYEVTATIWVETPADNRGGSPIQGEELLEAQSWVELLRTYAVLDPVVIDQKLYLSAANGPHADLFREFDLAKRFAPGSFELSIDREGRSYTLRHMTRPLSESGAVGDSIGRTMGFLWHPRFTTAHHGQKIVFDVLQPREASQRLSDNLVSVLLEQNFLRLRLTGTDADKTADIMNTLIERYVAEAAALKRAKLTELATVLDSQVVEQENRLKSAEEELEGFRVRTVTEPREQAPVAPGLQLTQPSVYSSYFEMRSQADALRRDRQNIEDVLARSRTGELAVDAFNTIPAVRNAPDLLRVLSELSTAEAERRTALGTYTEQAPVVLALTDKIQILRNQTIPLYAQALVSQLREDESLLESRIGQAGREMRSIPSRTQTENRLSRDQALEEQLFTNLATRQAEARLAEASSIPDLRIHDAAVAPTRPTKNQAGQLILIGFAAGVGLGLGLALLLDRLDRRFRYPDQVSRGLGLPILGTIPQIRKSKMADSAEETAQVVEAFRSVRLNLAHSFEPKGPILLTVSSPSPGDGKSLVSSNLALSFAEAGYRTLLVDGDIRRGDLHRAFGAERYPGLLDYLSNGTEVAGTLRPTSHPRLMLMPTGTRRREGPELLGTGRMQELIKAVGAQFDAVIIDTPPLGAGIDPFVLSTVTRNLVLVLRAGETDRQLAEAKLQVLDRLPIRLLGAILNDVRLGEGAYRYYAYSYGYVSADEKEISSLPARKA